MATEGPALVLAGWGMGEGAQLTVEAQQALVAAGHVHVIAPPPGVLRHLKGLRLGVTDLGERFGEEAGYADAYLDIADYLLRRAATDPPVVLLLPGNPLFQNSLARFLLQTARERELAVELYPGVSVLDALISDLGLDVTTRGLQVFDARHLVGLQHAANPQVPLVVLQLGGLVAGSEAPPEQAYRVFAEYLGRFYPAEHAVTLITQTTGRGQVVHATVRLGRFEDVIGHIGVDSLLFVDRVRAS